MPSFQSTSPVNRLLGALPSSDLRRFVARCETVELAFAEVLYTPREVLRHVYFPTGSHISLIMAINDSESLEVGRIGDEGMFGIPLRLGVDVSPVGAVVQGAGPALRMNAASFRRELERSPALQREIDRYVFVQLSQLAQAAACTRFHVVEARLARWLLMTPGPGARGQFPCHPGILRLFAWRAPGRRHEGGERPSEAEADPLQPWRSDGS